jgi:hypothetical protein
VAVALGALLLAACGGDSDSSGSKTTAAVKSPTPVRPMFDFGDAMDPNYPTKLESDGARHKDVTRAWLGATVDVERSAGEQEDVLDYTGDKYDDGLMAALPIEVAVTNGDWDGPLYLNMLLDYNKDGDWEDEGEWVIQNLEVTVPPGETMEIPTEVAFQEETQLRITLTGSPLTDYHGTGEFEIGETEDFMWTTERSAGTF